METDVNMYLKGDTVYILKTTTRGKYYKKPRVFIEGVVERCTSYEGELYFLVRWDTARDSRLKGMPDTTVGWYPSEGLLPKGTAVAGWHM